VKRVGAEASGARKEEESGRTGWHEERKHPVQQGGKPGKAAPELVVTAHRHADHQNTNPQGGCRIQQSGQGVHLSGLYHPQHEG